MVGGTSIRMKYVQSQINLLGKEFIHHLIFLHAYMVILKKERETII